MTVYSSYKRLRDIETRKYPFSVKDIASCHEVSERTVKRDIRFLRDSGVNIFWLCDDKKYKVLK